MNRHTAAFLAGALFLLTLPSASRSESDGVATSFCAECWKFLKAEDSVRQNGLCLSCGKMGIAVDAWELTWTWCEDHQAWHGTSCPEVRSPWNAPRRTAPALVISPGDERLRTEAYCPECGMFPDPMKMERGRCPACRGPLAVVDTAEVGWFWCTHDLHWKGRPCPKNGARHCCSARRGTLLVKVR